MESLGSGWIHTASVVETRQLMPTFPSIAWLWCVIVSLRKHKDLEESCGQRKVRYWVWPRPQMILPLTFEEVEVGPCHHIILGLISCTAMFSRGEWFGLRMIQMLSSPWQPNHCYITFKYQRFSLTLPTAWSVFSAEWPLIIKGSPLWEVCRCIWYIHSLEPGNECIRC